MAGEVVAFSVSIIAPLLIQRIKICCQNERYSKILHQQQCTVSAPGKILIAGGYLVLENPNVGVTISATARFHTTVQFNEVEKRSSSKNLQIVVESPQFGSEYIYSLSLDNHLSSQSEISNPFVEKCLSMTFSYIRQYMGSNEFEQLISFMSSKGKLKIILHADNDFYSQMSELDRRGLPYLSKSLRQLPAFLNCPRDSKGELVVAKTGMGSSAALTTSLVASLLQFFHVINLNISHSDQNNDRAIIHNLSQLIHSVAQGKIGSGFDVAAAVYGSQFYRRFSESNIPFHQLINDDPNGELLYSIVNDSSLWNQSILPFHLPEGMDIVMGDVCGGSSSSSMAKAVLAWKKNEPEFANTLWNQIRDTNETMSRLLFELSKRSHESKTIYREVCQAASLIPNTEWSSISCSSNDHQEILNLLIALRDNFILCRSDLKLMGRSAGTDIEPDQQTHLANVTSSLPGVLCSGVPGAGGVDAIYALVLSSQSRHNVEIMWSKWGESKNKESTSSSFSSSSSSRGCRVCPLMLSVDQGSEAGIQIEY